MVIDCPACKGSGHVKKKGEPARVCPECGGSGVAEITSVGEPITKAEKGERLTRRGDSGERL